MVHHFLILCVLCLFTISLARPNVVFLDREEERCSAMYEGKTVVKLVCRWLGPHRYELSENVNLLEMDRFTNSGSLKVTFPHVKVVIDDGVIDVCQKIYGAETTIVAGVECVNKERSETTATHQLTAGTTRPESTEFDNPTTHQPKSTEFDNPTTHQPKSTEFDNPTTHQPKSTEFDKPTTHQPKSTEFGIPTTTRNQPLEETSCQSSQITVTRIDSWVIPVVSTLSALHFVLLILLIKKICRVRHMRRWR